MAESLRALVIASPGVAADRMAQALNDVGAASVDVFAPDALQSAPLLRNAPNVVVVLLDHAVETALDSSNVDDVLRDPSLMVIFDEAEIVAKREGWELARWARHLDAKVHRHDNVLPPPTVQPGGVEGVAVAPPPVTSAPTAAPHFVPETPAPPAPAAVPTAAPTSAPSAMVWEQAPAEDPDAQAFIGLTLEDDGMMASPALTSSPPAAIAVAEAEPDIDFSQFVDGPIASADDGLLTFDEGEEEQLPPPTAAPALLLDDALDGRPVTGVSTDGIGGVDIEEPAQWTGWKPPVMEAVVDDPFAALAAEPAMPAQSDAPLSAAPDAGLEWKAWTPPPLPEEDAVLSFDAIDAAPNAPVAPTAAPSAPMALALDDGDAFIAPPPTAAPRAASGFASAESLESRIAHLSLVDDDATTDAAAAPATTVGFSPAAAVSAQQGALLLEGGLGAPDATRRLLAALPSALTVPVLVRLQIHGGRYDKLVEQLAKVSPLPVHLAQAGDLPAAGHVYVVAPGLELTDGGTRFVAGGGNTVGEDGVDPQASLWVLLSGSAAQLVGHAADGRWPLAHVVAQSAASSYDSAAADAWEAQGGRSAEVDEIVAMIGQRWSASA